MSMLLSLEILSLRVRSSVFAFVSVKTRTRWTVLAFAASLSSLPRINTKWLYFDSYTTDEAVTVRSHKAGNELGLDKISWEVVRYLCCKGEVLRDGFVGLECHVL